jgi:hypothetical protein
MSAIAIGCRAETDFAPGRLREAARRGLMCNGHSMPLCGGEAGQRMKAENMAKIAPQNIDYRNRARRNLSH